MEDLLFIVDVSTGNRTVLSDFNDGNQGPTGTQQLDMAEDSSGNILVTDGNFGFLFSVDPTTGNRTILSDFKTEIRDQRPTFRNMYMWMLQEIFSFLPKTEHLLLPIYCLK